MLSFPCIKDSEELAYSNKGKFVAPEILQTVSEIDRYFYPTYFRYHGGYHYICKFHLIFRFVYPRAKMLSILSTKDSGKWA